MFEIIIHMKAKAWVPTSFDRGFANCAKSWIQLRTNTVHYHFAFLSPGSCFKSTICIQLESAPISDHLVFAAVEGWQNYSPVVRKIWGLCWPWSYIQKPPKHRFMFFPCMLSAKEVILRSKNETKGLEVCGFSQQRNMLPEEAHWLATTITNCPRAEQILLNRLAKSIMYCRHDLHYITLHYITLHYITLHFWAFLRFFSRIHIFSRLYNLPPRQAFWSSRRPDLLAIIIVYASSDLCTQHELKWSIWLMIIHASRDLCTQYKLGDQYDLIIVHAFSDLCTQYKLSD